MSVAVLMCIYGGDSITQFKEALESITIKQNAVDESIHVYLHIDGEISKELDEYINRCGLIYKKVVSENNVGLASGLNRLIACLEDERYVFRMDSDDISLPERLLKQISFMDSNPTIDISGGSICEFIMSKDNIVTTRRYPTDHLSIANVIHKFSPIAHVTVCFRKSALINLMEYPINYPLNEDIAMWFKGLRSKCIFGNIKDTLVLVRMDGAYSRRTIKKANSEFKVYFNICRWKQTLPTHAVLRYFFRLLPSCFVKVIYNSKIRQLLLKS
ncbi:glycosyltransferase [Vibrio sp. 10N.261.52.A1]|uniref:glycosyltransferase n=1 Tax=Vibrio TaxID=662 RepID=UPI000C84D0D1|nr:glycosyltransferase [Vibrio sp. 10N.261.52.A1]PML15381.1 hypothetical protein BCT81_24780 [Vibrio sp. 10N.261.52.A1]